MENHDEKERSVIKNGRCPVEIREMSAVYIISFFIDISFLILSIYSFSTNYHQYLFIFTVITYIGLLLLIPPIYVEFSLNYSCITGYQKISLKSAKFITIFKTLLILSISSLFIFYQNYLMIPIILLSGISTLSSCYMLYVLNKRIRWKRESSIEIELDVISI